MIGNVTFRLETMPFKGAVDRESGTYPMAKTRKCLLDREICDKGY